MWIFLGIVGFLAALIFVILILPVYIIIKTDKDGEAIIRYKILHKTFGEDPDPNNPIIKSLKDALGINKLQKEQLKTKAEKSGFLDTVNESVGLIMRLIKALLGILKHCTVKKLKLKIICSESDAAKTAISYGKCCAIAAPLVGFLNSVMKIRKKRQDINISCVYENGENVFEFDAVLVVSVYRVLTAFLKAAYEEAFATAQNGASANISK